MTEIGFMANVESEAKPPVMGAAYSDRRKTGVRRDFNALIRGKDGEISGSKIATYCAQFLAGRHIYLMTDLPTWDVLAVLFLVLIAPEAYKQMMAMKWGGSAGSFTEHRESSRSESTTKGPA